MIQKEIKSLTGVRGVAALYVAIYHYYTFYNVSTTNSFITSLLFHGYLSVDLFFILSAFVLSLSSTKFEKGISVNDYKLFMQKRWIRIYPAYFIVVTVSYFFVYSFTERLPNLILSLTLLNLAVNTSSIFTHIWSLSAEWVMYIIFPIVIFWNSLFKVRSILLILAGISLLILAILFYKGKLFIDFPLEISKTYATLLRCIGGYFMGIAAFEIFKTKYKQFLQKGTTSFIIVGLIITSLVFPPTDILTVLLFIPLIVSIAHDRNWLSGFLSSKIIYFLGKISYPLYLIHYILLLKSNSVATFFNKSQPKDPPFTVFIIYILTTVALAYLFTSFVEKPILSFLSKRLALRSTVKNK